MVTGAHKIHHQGKVRINDTSVMQKINVFSLISMQVTHRETGEVMVLKEILRYDEETNAGFLKEVSKELFEIFHLR